MAKEELTGNLATESLIDYFDSLNIEIGLNKEAMQNAFLQAKMVFP